MTSLVLPVSADHGFTSLRSGEAVPRGWCRRRGNIILPGMWLRLDGPAGGFIVRKCLRRSEAASHLRFLTFSCCKCLPLLLNDRIKSVLVAHLEQACAAHEMHLIAWVIMPDHVHLLVLPGRQNSTSRFLHALKRLFARQVISRWRALGAPILRRITDKANVPHFWQAGGGYDQTLESDEEASNVVDYIHGNPVEARLVDHVTDWKWSSARFYAGEGYEGPPIARIEFCRWWPCGTASPGAKRR